MNITKEPNGDLQAVVHINITEEDYKDKVNETLKSYRKKANMPGFRPGMVPMGLIKKMYGASVMADEINKLVSEALDKYIYDNKLDLLGHPLANMEKTKQIDFAKDKEFDFYFDIAVAPDIEVDLKSEDFKTDYYKIKATDKEIDITVEDFKNKFGEEIEPEEVAEGDFIDGTLTQVDEEGNPVEGGLVKDIYFNTKDLKLKKIIKEFIGKKVGDVVSFNIKKAFDAKRAKELLGDDATGEQLKADYKLEIKKIRRFIPAELNEELFEKAYPGENIKTEEEFRNRIKKDLELQYEKESDRKFVDDVVKKLTEKINFDLPVDFLKRWLFESNQGQITKEQIEQQWESFAQSLKWQVIEAKLNKLFDNVLNVSNEDVRNKVRSYFGIRDRASSNDQIEQIVDQVLSNPQEESRIYNDLKTEKLAKVFNENVPKEVKEVTVDEYLEMINPKTPEAEKEEEKKEKKKEKKTEKEDNKKEEKA